MDRMELEDNDDEQNRVPGGLAEKNPGKIVKHAISNGENSIFITVLVDVMPCVMLSCPSSQQLFHLAKVVVVEQEFRLILLKSVDGTLYDGKRFSELIALNVSPDDTGVDHSQCGSFSISSSAVPPIILNLRATHCNEDFQHAIRQMILKWSRHKSESSGSMRWTITALPPPRVPISLPAPTIEPTPEPFLATDELTESPAVNPSSPDLVTESRGGELESISKGLISNVELGSTSQLIAPATNIQIMEPNMEPMRKQHEEVIVAPQHNKEEDLQPPSVTEPNEILNRAVKNNPVVPSKKKWWPWRVADMIIRKKQ
ncbi:hypothetical protein BDV93DRAFT_557504 [Ceratobasidium sp. AG-I]|nr:hypothetical protein BDV93DRAFT_557504 [Ceratobasidium sp. AG-I]